MPKITPIKYGLKARCRGRLRECGRLHAIGGLPLLIAGEEHDIPLKNLPGNALDIGVKKSRQPVVSLLRNSLRVRFAERAFRFRLSILLLNRT